MTGRLQRRFTFWTIPSILKIPVGFIQSLIYLIKIKPKAILSFGGFASFPVVFNAKLLRIPVIIHEQTSAAGRANLASAKFADKITLARSESKRYFTRYVCEVTGNPIMREIVQIKPLVKPGDVPTIFVTGGSRGSQSINTALEPILKPLLKKYKVIHLTGGLDHLKFSEFRQKLPRALRDNYQVFIRINPLMISKIYSQSSLIVSRAGANTVSEIIQIKRPAILIPLPISYLNEQLKNAKIAQKWGVAKTILQKDLTPGKLMSVINDMVVKTPEIIRKVKGKVGPDYKASEKIVKLISTYIK
jgi:UDP-N-acetylglucosamine--N-acetylmuramyl-(pentapeptide) pyrophosphoryl-undecaprenol N-acetylglucosamine transferase